MKDRQWIRTLSPFDITERVTRVFEDAEAMVYRVNAGATNFQDLMNRNLGRLRDLDYPNLRSAKFFFDYGPGKPKVKDLMRSQRPPSKSIVKIDEDHVQHFLFSDCATKDVEVIRAREERFLHCRMTSYGQVESFSTFMQSLLNVMDWRANMRCYFAKAIMLHAKTSMPGIEVEVLNVHEGFGKYFDYSSRGDPQPVETTNSKRPGEGEIAIIREIEAILRADPTEVPLGKTTDSDAFAVGLLSIAIGRISVDSEFYLEIGTTTYDIPKTYRAIMDWGDSNEIADPLTAVLLAMMIGGSDYVRSPQGLGVTTLIRKTSEFGFNGPRLCSSISNGRLNTKSIDEWINMVEFERFLVALCVTNAPPKRKNPAEPAKQKRRVTNTRTDRFEALVNNVLQSSQLSLLDGSLDASNGKRGYVTIPQDEHKRSLWMKTLKRQMLWQLIYWAEGPICAEPDPLAQEDGEWVWGWKRNAVGTIQHLDAE